MVVAVIGIVQEKHVARLHPIAEDVPHGRDRPGDRADVDRHVLGLGHEPRLPSQMAVEKSRLEFRICE